MMEINHDDSVLNNFILFVQTAREVLKYVDAYLYRKARLSMVKLVVLRTLDSHNRGMRPYELAIWTQTEPHNITTLVDRMEQEGLVKSERDRRDRRYVNVTLLDKGRESLRLAMPVAREIADQVMSSVSEVDALQLEKLLKVLRQNVHRGFEQIGKPVSPRPV